MNNVTASLRQTMMNRVDDYMNSLASFRHKSLLSMELFEKELHQFLLSSVRNTIKMKTASEKLANRAMSYSNLVNARNVSYNSAIAIYKKVIEFFHEKKSTIPTDVINSVRTQLENTNHSHGAYLPMKIDNLTKMLRRFANVEEVLPEFSQLFRQCLHHRYDHLFEQEVFSTNARIQNEIFDHLTQNNSVNNIKKIVNIFQNGKLSNILTKCDSFLQDKDEKGITEISECLRQCILDTTEDYTSSLLTFRRTALIAFNHFEQDF
ncbi:unnamed protein product [Didymodactylos carnosus]|uniref:Uncharacterized protein n=1 Tax=Didymodactylos carnosus TaxID=1234261 RepID=A0A815WQL2_9BILA|nr:unnamed protein product [Didymodactylos carnosus]CAF4405477.1 unnamed protein product [Didymodactylos carnosus]